jgi:hypothetical protein
VVSEKKTDDEQCGGGRALDANAFLERESLRSLLSRPFFWLAYLAVVVLLVFLWSAEHVEGARATDGD